MFLNSLLASPRRDVAFRTPGVGTGYSVRIRGVGTFKTDRTPWPEGTTEFEMDPRFNQRLDRMAVTLESITNSLQTFARAMDEHVALIREIQGVVSALKQVVEAIKPAELMDKGES